MTFKREPFMLTMTWIIEGTVLHEYPDGSCLSCGGEVLSIADKQGLLHDACVRCGPVQLVKLTNDAGAPLRGFLSLAEFRALPVPRDDGAAPHETS